VDRFEDRGSTPLASTSQVKRRQTRQTDNETGNAAADLQGDSRSHRRLLGSAAAPYSCSSPNQQGCATKSAFSDSPARFCRVWGPGGKNVSNEGSQPAKTGQFLRRSRLLAYFLNAPTKRGVDTADLKLDTQPTLNVDLTLVFEGLDNSYDDQWRLRDGSSDFRQS